MTDPFVWTAITLASLAGLVVVTLAALKGWREWISLQRLAVEGRPHAAEPGTTPGPMARIELADLKERVRKLEAIAAGVDL
jgi:heme exporter protein D